MDERWLAIPGYEGIYEVSDAGRVRGLNRITPSGRRWRGRLMKSATDRRGYPSVMLFDTKFKRFSVHCLVLAAFVGPRPIGMEGCHNNGVRTDNRVGNLRWDTRRNNHLDKQRHGTHKGFSLGVRKREHVIPPGKPRHCRRGHAYTQENSFVRRDGRGTVECRTCMRERTRNFWAAKADQKLAALRAASEPPNG